MLLGKKLLAVFLEKDNVKLLTYEVRGKRAVRLFAGQITFAAEVVKDAFVADPIKFGNQIKVAFSQKPQLAETTDAVIFLPADKAFVKTLPAEDSVDGFIQSLPYFAEELILTQFPLAGSAAGRGRSRTTYVAFEKKLVEDLQRPFLELGKKVAAIANGLSLVTTAFRQEGNYLLLVLSEKEVSVAVAETGGVAETASFAREVFAGRLGEFLANHDLGAVRKAYTVGVFDPAIAQSLRSERGLEVASLDNGDVYDLVVGAYVRSAAGGGGLARLFSKWPPEAVRARLPGQKYLFLAGAVAAGFVLVVLLVKGVGGWTAGLGKKTAPVEPVAKPVEQKPPEPKRADYPVAVLNGTLVTGEAGRLGETLTGLGFDVVKTGNATAAGFVNTRLRVTADVPAKVVDDVKSQILTVYQGVTVEPLSAPVTESGATQSAKIEVIIGKKK